MTELFEMLPSIMKAL